jgi:multidrug efflux pump subunit AcrA (membrane-fusion protein)
VNFGVPQQDSRQASIGRNVRITIEDLAGASFVGRVTAVNAVVDEATRNIQIQATLANPKHVLRPGMFVQAEVLLGVTSAVVALPASAISRSTKGSASNL